jgi:pyruvate/2-oxoglutarate dehydrogenase complex dihydrolipoamide acyltransferase (E2) component
MLITLKMLNNIKSFKNIFNVTSRMLSSLPPHIVVAMPALSPTMTSGTVVSWNCKVGDKISPGDSLADIQTDKANMSFEAQDDFYIAKFLVEKESEVSVGSPILISVEDESHIKAFESYVISVKSEADPPKSSVAAISLPIIPVPISVPVIEKVVTPLPVPQPSVIAPTVVAIPEVKKESKKEVSNFTHSGSISANWGKSAVNSPLFKKLSTQQSNYIKKYGRSSHKPLSS